MVHFSFRRELLGQGGWHDIFEFIKDLGGNSKLDEVSSHSLRVARKVGWPFLRPMENCKTESCLN